MKKKVWIPILIAIVLAVLFVPIPKDALDDGGTREYKALTYKIVDWRRLTGHGMHEKTCVYWGKDRARSLEELWEEEMRTISFDEWLDKDTASFFEGEFSDDFRIDEIWADCFFSTTVVQGEYRRLKINGVLSDEWCVGDMVYVTYEHVYDDGESKAEGDLVSIEPSNEPNYVYAKPVIYLYPEKETDVSVKLTLDGEFTCTYPAYHNGWHVTAFPDGTLIDANGQVYRYLYWEGNGDTEWDMSRGFCVKGEDTAAFLEEALAKLGLTREEANEFIIYWLPLMQENPYNIISFQGERYEDSAKLEITPAPNTVIRVFMTYKVSDVYVEMDAQELTAPEREGFTVVEWGGAEWNTIE